MNIVDQSAGIPETLHRQNTVSKALMDKAAPCSPISVTHFFCRFPRGAVLTGLADSHFC
jgi:hypothetical protein